MNDTTNIDDDNGNATSTGRQIAVDTFMDIHHDKKNMMESARNAAQALLDDMESSSRQQNEAELTAFIDELLSFSREPSA